MVLIDGVSEGKYWVENSRIKAEINRKRRKAKISKVRLNAETGNKYIFDEVFIVYSKSRTSLGIGLLIYLTSLPIRKRTLMLRHQAFLMPILIIQYTSLN